jgi:hypothetical protein
MCVFTICFLTSLKCHFIGFNLTRKENLAFLEDFEQKAWQRFCHQIKEQTHDSIILANLMRAFKKHFNTENFKHRNSLMQMFSRDMNHAFQKAEKEVSWSALSSVPEVYVNYDFSRLSRSCNFMQKSHP